MSDLTLNRSERNSTALMKLREYLAARLAEHRGANDYDQPPEKTSMLRGRIAEAKALLEAIAPEE